MNINDGIVGYEAVENNIIVEVREEGTDRKRLRVIIRYHNLPWDILKELRKQVILKFLEIWEDAIPDSTRKNRIKRLKKQIKEGKKKFHIGVFNGMFLFVEKGRMIFSMPIKKEKEIKEIEKIVHKSSAKVNGEKKEEYIIKEKVAVG